MLALFNTHLYYSVPAADEIAARESIVAQPEVSLTRAAVRSELVVIARELAGDDSEDALRAHPESVYVPAAAICATSSSRASELSASAIRVTESTVTSSSWPKLQAASTIC